MYGRPPQSRRAGRSNLYSQSKYTNWARYDPFELEISAHAVRMRPIAVVSLGPAVSLPIYQRPLHRRFVRPVAWQEVKAFLEKVPPEYLHDLEGIYLLGGSHEQEKASRGRLFCFGMYQWRRVYLCAFPRARMERHYKRRPRPDWVQEFERAGASWEAVSDGWVCRFSTESLRRFYLHDVLVHEIGHHLERHLRRPAGTSERFARGFAAAFTPQSTS